MREEENSDCALHGGQGKPPSQGAREIQHANGRILQRGALGVKRGVQRRNGPVAQLCLFPVFLSFFLLERERERERDIIRDQTRRIALQYGVANRDFPTGEKKSQKTENKKTRQKAKGGKVQSRDKQHAEGMPPQQSPIAASN